MRDDLSDVRSVLQEAFGQVHLEVSAEEIEARGRTRRARRRVVTTAGACAAVAALTLAVQGTGGGSAPPSQAGNSTGAGAVHVRTAAYTVDTKTDGTIHVTWDKERYFADHAGLERALNQARFPVLIKVGEFCRGRATGSWTPAASGPASTR